VSTYCHMGDVRPHVVSHSRRDNETTHVGLERRHALVTRQSRLAVSIDTLRTAAVSSIVSPPK